MSKSKPRFRDKKGAWKLTPKRKKMADSFKSSPEETERLRQDVKMAKRRKRVERPEDADPMFRRI